MSALLSLAGIAVSLGGRRVIDDVSLTLQAGDIVALLGPNGAGKTSLLRACLGLLPLGAGSALLGREEARNLTPRARARRVAYLPQRPQAIWPVSVEALVALGRFAHSAAPDRLRPRDQAAVDSALEACALTPLRARRVDEISGGELARAHLARALAQQAPLLLLDEPSAGLDPAQALGVAEILRAHAQAGGAVLLATHDLNFAARFAPRVLVLAEGRAIAEGAPAAALTPEIMQRAYGRAGRLESTSAGAVAVFE